MKEQIEEIAMIIDDAYDNAERTGSELHCYEVAEKIYNEVFPKQREGEWIKRTFIIFDSEKIGFTCSECNTTWDTETKFCPNCGARMMKGEEK